MIRTIINLFRGRLSTDANERRLQNILQRVPRDRIAELIERYAADPSDLRTHTNFVKYADLEKYVRENLRRVLMLELEKRSAMRILDLGSGFGWFLFIARYFGHTGIGIDVHDEGVPHCRMFEESFGILGLERSIHRITPTSPLPTLEGKFDLVTGFQTQFNKLTDATDQDLFVPPDARWGPTEWEALRLAIQNVANRDCEMFLRLNKPDSWSTWYTDEVLEYFTFLGAEVEGPYVRLRVFQR